MDFRDKPSIDDLIHYGMPRRSGRYRYGSGEDPYQHSGDFLSRIDELKKQGLTDTEIAASMKLTTTQFRTQRSLANDERRQLEVDTAKGLREKGYSLPEIANKMGYNNDSSIRSLLNQNSEARMKEAYNTSEFLKKQVDEKGMIDVGAGVERELNISKEKMKQALYMLEMEGYEVYGGGVPQATNAGKQTNLKVLCPPGTEHKDIYNFEKINSLREYVSHDGGESFDKFVYPKSMDSKRLKIRYAEDGGLDKDGLIEIRRGVDDLSLGKSTYAQVRILVDDDRYIKGMAVYRDDMPKGVDIVFNTNKTKDKEMRDVLKPIKENDPENPFGSLIKAGGQSYYTDKDGNKQLSLINKRAEEGDWGEWKDKLSSQFLSKQSRELANKQLNLEAADRQAEYDEICSLTNPTIKKALLKSFSDDCDSAAVHLQAAALPRQKHQVIIPIPTMKDNEIYAPRFNNGETVALVRYPHGGTFEIPILKVNNKQEDAKKLLGNALDAVGINKANADRLSGADFDGDTVMVLPTGSKIKISSEKELEDLKGFDAKMQYGGKEPGTFKLMKTTQKEMGAISNLITDMTLLGAKSEELARAVKHSMVVIDAEKHKLDYKQSEKDNRIMALKKRYQQHENDDKFGGAATLISRAKSELSIEKRKGSPKIDPETGKQSWDVTDDLYYDIQKINKKTGAVTTKTKTRTQQSTQMAETDDAYTLLSKTRPPMEVLYADYANKMKSLANSARKEMISTKNIPYSSDAKAKYIDEYKTLDSKLNVALMNAPRERKAQIIANATVKAKKLAHPDMTKAELKKEGQRALMDARVTVGAKKERINFTDREWEAIQAGAISPNKLKQIIDNSDLDSLRQRATPKATQALSPAKINLIQTMTASGHTSSEIAKRLGVSSSTIVKYIKGKE